MDYICAKFDYYCSFDKKVTEEKVESARNYGAPKTVVVIRLSTPILKNICERLLLLMVLKATQKSSIKDTESLIWK